jgi:hypothetical protein
LRASSRAFLLTSDFFKRFLQDGKHGKVAWTAGCLLALDDISQGRHQNARIAQGHRQRPLQNPEILDALSRRPIQEIIIRRLAEKSTSAFYQYDDQSITVNSARKLGVHFGGSFRPGYSRSMSWATTDKIESLRRAMLHELAHHFEGFTEAKALMEEGFERPDKRPITRYAGTEWGEYFAESFVAHFVEPSALAKYDPNGSMMVMKVLSAVRK